MDDRGDYSPRGATPVSIELHGFKELNDLLASYSDRVAKRLVKGALVKALAPVLQSAKAMCPVSADGSHGKPAGYLRDSLVLKTMPARKRLPGEMRAGLTTRKGAFESGKYYGGYLEYGTHKMAARPFLRPAIDQNKQQVLDNLKTEILAAIEGQKSFDAGFAAGQAA
jgi:HK97 gp10 family phage protein